MTDARFERALGAIDAANAADPNHISVRGVVEPKELAHARLVTGWVLLLCPDAGPELLLAARAHHVCRWMIPRSSHPSGRRGYLRWRRALHDLHVERAGAILAAVGYDEVTIGRVQDLIAKRGLGEDPEVQTLEDALCLVFVETQLHELAERLDRDKILHVTRATLDKMSDEATALALTIELPDEDHALLRRALAQQTSAAATPADE